MHIFNVFLRCSREHVPGRVMKACLKILAFGQQWILGSGLFGKIHNCYDVEYSLVLKELVISTIWFLSCAVIYRDSYNFVIWFIRLVSYVVRYLCLSFLNDPWLKKLKISLIIKLNLVKISGCLIAYILYS